MFTKICLQFFHFYTQVKKGKKKVKNSIEKGLKNVENDEEMLDSTLELEEEDILMMYLDNDDNRGTKGELLLSKKPLLSL